MQLRRIALGTAIALGVGVFWAPSASATFHEISIREVYAGSALEPSTEYVELQMWRSGQNLVGTHVLRTYGAGGGEVKANVLPSNVPGEANQSTILIATSEAASHFGVTPDATLSPSGQLDPSGGAVCWESIDCVSWGNFSGSLPSPAGTPATAVPNEMALRRTIAPGCATLLEPTDDRDNSAIDLSAVFPAPRPNSSTPSEHPCASTAGGETGGSNNQGGHGPPQTNLKRKPPHKTTDRTPTFRFGADQASSTYQCKLDGRPFKACRSPFTTKTLTLGPHTFKVRARDESGKLDPSPASYSFRLVAKR
jgi:hypothetical protein